MRVRARARVNYQGQSAPPRLPATPPDGFPEAAICAPGGPLVAVCANGTRQREELGEVCTQWIDQPAGSFRSQGTSVNAAIVVLGT